MNALTQLSLGQHIEGRVERILDSDRLFVSLEGTYIFVLNNSAVRFKVGDQVELLVDSLRPLVLKIARAGKDSLGHIDINV